MALVSDPAAEGFNSYVSVDEATAYFGTFYFGSSQTWDDVADHQEALLITATRRLNTLPWNGTPFSDTQLLAFPRTFYTGEYGYSDYPNVAPVPISGWIPVAEVEEVDASIYIPFWLKQATCEMAYWIWTEGERPFSDVEFAQLKSQKVGPLSYEARDSALNMSPTVYALLSSLGPMYITLGTSARSMSMVY
jgi:hypothetical protein